MREETKPPKPPVVAQEPLPFGAALPSGWRAGGPSNGTYNGLNVSPQGPMPDRGADKSFPERAPK